MIGLICVSFSIHRVSTSAPETHAGWVAASLSFAWTAGSSSAFFSAASSAVTVSAGVPAGHGDREVVAHRIDLVALALQGGDIGDEGAGLVLDDGEDVDLARLELAEEA